MTDLMRDDDQGVASATIDATPINLMTVDLLVAIARTAERAG